MIISQADVLAGDVLLCQPIEKGFKTNPVHKKIKQQTGSPYTHAAILIAGSQIMDARPGCGVVVRPLTDLLEETNYVAVLRQRDAWDNDRLDGLQDYAASLQALGAGYNYRDALNYSKYKRWHAENVTTLLHNHFDKDNQSNPTDFGPFFCSELVAGCFINSGYISPDAAVALDPAQYAPGDLAKESAFGFLVGFLAGRQDFEIPSDDPLLKMTKYFDVHGS